MKKMLAIATIAALLGGGSAFAADSRAMRLDDAQMDGFTAGAKNSASNYVIIAPITNVDVNSIALALGDGATATNISTIIINNTIYVIQYIKGGGGGGGGNGYAFGHNKQATKVTPPGLAKKLG